MQRKKKGGHHDLSDSVVYCKSKLLGIGLLHTVELAEALAAHRAVVYAKEFSIYNVVVEGDCLWIVQALKALDRYNTLYENVIEYTHSQGCTVQHCQFQYGRQEGNKLAHTLARRTVLTANTDVQVEELPNDLDNVFQTGLL